MHGTNYRREWRKVHLGIDAHTREIRASMVPVERGDVDLWLASTDKNAERLLKLAPPGVFQGGAIGTVSR